MKRLLFFVLLAGLSSACAAAQAKAPADRPTLVVPEPPPRMIDAPPQAEPASPDPVDEVPPTSPAPAPKSKPTPSRETPRNEPKPPETPPTEQPATPPTTTQPPVPTAPQLRPPGAGSGPEAAKQVRDLIDRAKKGLDSVDYRHLNTAQQGQYNTAKLMLTNAEEHLKGSNFDIARELADKANRIATELQGR
jgi:hypothetical protein